jgi:type IV pilus assembly protein PilV
MTTISKYRYSSGFSLMEVLITMIIILIGLLGIVALQGKAQLAELEAYQRAQAMIMLSDITDSINANRSTATCFNFTSNTTTGTPYIGFGSSYTSSCSASTSAYNTQTDNTIAALDGLLKGTAETLNGNNVGSMIGARACISYDTSTELSGVSGTGQYTVIVTWQGMGDLVSPTGLLCAVGNYGAETKRRAVATKIRIADLY